MNLFVQRPHKLLTIVRHTIVRNMIWMLFGQMSKVLIQAVYFVIIARYLGVAGYGAFIGTTAIVSIFSSFSGLGSGNILIKHVSRNHNLFSFYWANALLTTFSSGVFLVALVSVVSNFVMPSSIPLSLVLVIAIGDVIAAKVIDISGQAFQAFHLLKITATLQIMMSLLRCISVVVLAALSHPSIILWGIVYMSSSLLLMVIAIIITNRKLGKPQLNFRVAPMEWKEGLYFSLSQTMQSGYNDLDKAMLVKMSSLEVGGIYSAASRIIDVAFSPVRSLLYALYAKFFQSGKTGLKHSQSLLKKVLPVSFVYGIIVAAALYLAAPMIPSLLGEEYRSAVTAIQILSVIPLLRTIHYFAADALTGADYQGIRCVIQIVTALVNVLLNLVMIPEMSWTGAAMVSIFSNIFMGVCLWITFNHLKNKERPLN
jgi:O-antigen/teichoic acid export membrane protein